MGLTLMNIVKSKLVEALDALDAWASENPDAQHIKRKRPNRLIVFRSYVCLQNWVKAFGTNDTDKLITHGSMIAGHRFDTVIFVSDPDDNARTHAERMQIAEWCRDCVTTCMVPGGEVLYV